MRRLLALFPLILALNAYAADPQPKDLQPVPEPPPAPANLDDANQEPQVTISTQGENKVEEYRLNGKLYMIKITPPNGVPYYLVDHTGDGRFARTESLDSGTRPPMWVLFRF
ncbi:MAG: DUF2782 domain-containing protein [Sulfuricellaceae bacterium]